VILGTLEGKNVVIEYRVAESKVERLPELLAELVRLRVDVIVTGGIINRAAKQATTTIPIVIAFDFDPVANGLVASFARPGGNITGLSARYPELSGKQLELLKEIAPRLSRVAIFGSSTEPGNTQVVREVEAAAEGLGVQHLYLDLQDPKDIETAFRAASKGRANALLVLGGMITVLTEHRLRHSRQRTGSQRCTQGRNLSMTAGLSPTARVLPTCTGAPLLMWIRSSKGQNQLTFRWSIR
jgi:putative ABC transport system substrate-binding protein